MIELQHVSKRYLTADSEPVDSLKDVSLSFPSAGLVFIVGPSGCGKSTLLNLIDGLDKPTSGKILYDGIDGASLKEKDWNAKRHSGISFIYQDYNLVNHLSVLENVMLPSTLGGASAKAKGKAMSLLKRVGLESKARKYPNQLSGGERQRVAIARALAAESEVILADEPTGALDTASGRLVMDILSTYKQSKLILVVSHNETLAKEYAERIVSLKDGEVVGDASVRPEGAPLAKREEKKGLANLAPLAFFHLNNRKAKSFFLALASSVGLIGMGLVLALKTGINNLTGEVEREALMGIGVPLSVYTYSVGLNDPTTYNTHAAFPDNYDIGSYQSELATPIHTNHITDEYVAYLKDNLPERTDLTVKYASAATVLTKTTGDYIKTYSPQSLNSITQLLYSFIGQGSDFHELPASESKVLGLYDLLLGQYPRNDDEAILVVDRCNNLKESTLENLGFSDPANTVSVKEAIGKEYKFLPYDDYYRDNGKTADVKGRFLKDAATLKAQGNAASDLYEYLSSAATNYYLGESKALKTEMAKVKSLFGEEETRTLHSYSATSSQSDLLNYFNDDSVGHKLKIVGLLRPKRSTLLPPLETGLYYTHDLWEKLRAENTGSQIAKEYENHLVYNESGYSITVPDVYEVIDNLDKASNDGIEMAVAGLADALDRRYAYGTDIGYGALEIYPDSLAEKTAITKAMDEYNEGKDADKQIKYLDVAGIVLGVVEKYVGVVSKTLLIFSSLSLLVSAIMMGLLTQNSVIEREREIGLYRSFGASRFEVSSLFVLEDSFLGLLSGLVGIAITYALIPLVNLVFNGAGMGTDLSHFATLPASLACLIVLLGLVVNVLGALLPSVFAAKKEAAVSLRSD
jgi:ABC-type lipoprotein export system ATPase subunit